MDLVVSCERFPRPGETLFAQSFAMYPGGKGANQAVACARLDSKVRFVSKMGADLFRNDLLKSLESNGIDPRFVLTDSDGSTGVALITVDEKGQNEILVASGSNMNLSPADVEAGEEMFSEAAVLLLQLEIPVETVERAAQIAKREGTIVVLNPAPARPLPDSLYAVVDFLTPNETEAEQLTGIKVSDARSAEDAGRWFLDKGVQNVVLTLGERGALLVSEEMTIAFPAPRVTPVDTTAAGDAFAGALAAGLARGDDVEDCISFANTVAALCVTKSGAQPSMPNSDEVAAFTEHLSFEPST